MRVSEITVSAGRTFNHPFESYSNLKPYVTVKAQLAEGEDWQEATKQLQATAERLVEDHKQTMLKSLTELEDLNRKQREMADLEASIRRAQAKLDQVRADLAAGVTSALDAPALDAPDDDEEDIPQYGHRSRY